VFRFGFALAPLCIATLSACHASSSNGAGDAPEAPKNGRFVIDAQNRKICELPLSSYCAEEPCEAFSKAAVTARALVSRTGIWGTVEIGTCGSFEVIERGAWYMHDSQIFDGEKLVGAEVSVDNLSQFCDGKSGHARYGTVPVCTFTPTEIILDGGGIPQ
jgi:hypothetical protein